MVLSKAEEVEVEDVSVEVAVVAVDLTANSLVSDSLWLYYVIISTFNILIVLLWVVIWLPLINESVILRFKTFLIPINPEFTMVCCTFSF